MAKKDGKRVSDLVNSALKAYIDGDVAPDKVGELVVSFAGYGLYYYDETNGWQFLNAVIPEDMKPINFYH